VVGIGGPKNTTTNFRLVTFDLLLLNNLVFYTRVTYFKEPHFTERQTGIRARSRRAPLYSVLVLCYQVGFADQHRPGQQSRSRFRRRGDCNLRAGVILSRWLVPSSDRDKQKFDRVSGRLIRHEKYS